jgi:ABC-type amino acid transport system permease subunit
MLSPAALFDLLTGVGTTVAICSIAIAAGMPLGLLIAAGRTGKNPILRLLCGLYGLSAPGADIERTKALAIDTMRW